MSLRNTTPVPNRVLDEYLAILTNSEFKVLIVIIRQTKGWVDKKTGKRKKKDRISISQFMEKTGLSKRIVSKAIRNLVFRRLIIVTSGSRENLYNPKDRRGKKFLYYQSLI